MRRCTKRWCLNTRCPPLRVYHNSNDVIKSVRSFLVKGLRPFPPSAPPRTYLKPKGVKLPRFKGKLGFSLTILAAHMGSFIHIDDIKKTLQENNFKLTGTDPVQVRHLSTQSGWWIEKEGKYKHKLCSTQEPLPGFIAQKRASKLDTNSWNALKHEYQNKCVNCGSKENEPLRWDQTKITALQQGHMDPRKDLTTNNCIPQCGFCNQAYKNKAIFNKRGIVVDFLRSGF